MATQNDTLLENELDTTHIKRFRVYLLNDDYTTMDFVVHVLMEVFHKQFNQAQDIMLQVHKNGKGLCGVYGYEVAETKVLMVRKLAKQNGFPLKAVMEEG